MNEHNCVFPTFGYLYGGPKVTGMSSCAVRFRDVGEAFFKRAVILNSFRENLNLIDLENFKPASLLVYEHRQLVLPNENGLFDFKGFSKTINLDSLNLDRFKRNWEQQTKTSYLN